jgi:hypothetical protein
MMVKVCIACGGFAEPPFTHIEDSRGRLTGAVVCESCLTAPAGGLRDDDASDNTSNAGGEAY